MLDFTELIIDDFSPIYEQIIRYVKTKIITDTVESGMELPSRRTLSAILKVNPNTVQKAYRVLEDDGLIYSTTGAKSILQYTSKDRERLQRELVYEETKRYVKAMKTTNIEYEELLDLIEGVWKEIR
jgi:GntR family transcriptional regulator